MVVTVEAMVVDLIPTINSTDVTNLKWTIEFCNFSHNALTSMTLKLKLYGGVFGRVFRKNIYIKRLSFHLAI